MEPKWNVKTISARVFTRRREVLMEPKWNVKTCTGVPISLLNLVLMEPKWNVKGVNNDTQSHLTSCINGTKVECKGQGTRKLLLPHQY